MIRIVSLGILLFPLSAPAAADSDEGPPPPAAVLGTDPTYRLASGDYISVNIHGEADMSTAQRMDPQGKLRLPLVGEVALAGLSVRDAEKRLEALYVERELLKLPLVSIAVTSYTLREVSVLGAVQSPGNFQFPKETTSMDIVDLITRLGGFAPTAKADAVTVIRRRPDGTEERFTVNVERMISGQRRGDTRRQEFAVYPGDRIWVPQRLF